MAPKALDIIKLWVEELSVKNRALDEENISLRLKIIELTQELEIHRTSSTKTGVNVETQVGEVSLSPGYEKLREIQSDAPDVNNGQQRVTTRNSFEKQGEVDDVHNVNEVDTVLSQKLVNSKPQGSIGRLLGRKEPLLTSHRSPRSPRVGNGKLFSAKRILTRAKVNARRRHIIIPRKELGKVSESGMSCQKNPVSIYPPLIEMIREKNRMNGSGMCIATTEMCDFLEWELYTLSPHTPQTETQDIDPLRLDPLDCLDQSLNCPTTAVCVQLE